jgi:hypothetical protein
MAAAFRGRLNQKRNEEIDQPDKGHTDKLN